jgi:hypothetical protein
MERISRLAVVGGGIAGLGAAWLLSRRYHVTLFERNDYVGGHTNTVECDLPDGRTPVDTGFIVYNELNYPNLTGLFRRLDVPTRASDMSFAFSSTAPDVEYAGDSLRNLFAQRRNLVRPAMWRMIGDILRFNRDAVRRAHSGVPATASLGDHLDELGLGEAFRRYYLLPMGAAIWSCPQEQMLDFPAEHFLRFFRNHGLVQLSGRPQWRTVCGGGREYVRRMLPAIPRVWTQTPVTRIRRQDGRVRIHDARGELGVFDGVVLACHADEALAMLEGPDGPERQVLGAFRYQANEAILHTDAGLMPRRRGVWSAWNHLSNGADDAEGPVSVTYWMNRLQALETETDVFVSLNPLSMPEDGHILSRAQYHHPVFDREAMAAQQHLGDLQGRRSTWFCGSYFGYGFHEDALRSAVQVAELLGVQAPWGAAPAHVAPAPSIAAAPLGSAVE